jgi:hypothetical protein
MEAGWLARLVVGATVVLTMVACGGEDCGVSELEYVRKVQLGTLAGEWGPEPTELSFLERLAIRLRSSTLSPEQMVLRVEEDGSCSLSSGLRKRFVACKHALPAGRFGPTACALRVDREGQDEWLAIGFEAEDRSWLVTHVSVFRHLTSGELSLAGTCGEGDAYSLVRRERRGRGRRTRG